MIGVVGDDATIESIITNEKSIKTAQDSYPFLIVNRKIIANPDSKVSRKVSGGRNRGQGANQDSHHEKHSQKNCHLAHLGLQHMSSLFLDCVPSPECITEADGDGKYESVLRGCW
ncbi:hypothetical protein V0M98_34710 (plasmid) [Pseudomonas silesiensis]|uniref:hypothetical protein n=1 Tax=Pseudomonas silesiensis TaxID=1853130 RepID=UPI0030CBD3F1